VSTRRESAVFCCFCCRRCIVAHNRRLRTEFPASQVSCFSAHHLTFRSTSTVLQLLHPAIQFLKRAASSSRYRSAYLIVNRHGTAGFARGRTSLCKPGSEDIHTPVMSSIVRMSRLHIFGYRLFDSTISAQKTLRIAVGVSRSLDR
jgi:hypothetical protein